MFRQLATQLGLGKLETGAELLFRMHPQELAALLEDVWQNRVHDTTHKLGHPGHRSSLSALPFNHNGLQPSQSNTDKKGKVGNGFIWDHLIYAYLIENTRCYDVFRQVIHEFVHGEKLGVPLNGSDHWLRATEDLFFRERPQFSIYGTTSSIRPNGDLQRGGTYQRLLGVDVGQRKDSKIAPVPSANLTFVSTFEELLREVWIGIRNENNSSGANPTDDATIADLAERLHDMLRARRLGGNLAREEFSAVCMMSWFHLSLEYDSSIVTSCRAEAASPEERLRKLGERVGVPVHTLAKSHFDMADNASLLLTQIETGIFNTETGAKALYKPPYKPIITSVARHWGLLAKKDFSASTTAVREIRAV